GHRHGQDGDLGPGPGGARVHPRAGLLEGQGGGGEASDPLRGKREGGQRGGIVRDAGRRRRVGRRGVAGGGRIRGDLASGRRGKRKRRIAKMQTLVLVLHILAALGIVVLVLLQHGKGADMGAAFGSGSAGSLFGSAGASNFLSKSTG